MLRKNGFSVTLACSGVEALGFLAAEEFDLVLLDVVMPVQSGFDVLKCIRELFTPRNCP